MMDLTKLHAEREADFDAFRKQKVIVDFLRLLADGIIPPQNLTMNVLKVAFSDGRQSGLLESQRIIETTFGKSNA